MSGPSENLATAKRYIRAIESGASGDELAQLFSPEVVVEIFPSRFFPRAAATTWRAFVPGPSAAKK